MSNSPSESPPDAPDDIDRRLRDLEADTGRAGLTADQREHIRTLVKRLDDVDCERLDEIDEQLAEEDRADLDVGPQELTPGEERFFDLLTRGPTRETRSGHP